MADSETTAAEAAPIAVFKKRGAKGKSNLRKRAASPPRANSDSDGDSDYSSEDETGQRVKRRRKNAVVTASSKNAAGGTRDLSATMYSADRSVPITSANDATKQSNWHEDDGDDDDLTAKSLLGSSSRAGGTYTGYKGLANQTSFIQKRPDAPQKNVGPIKAATNIRTITVTDYAPDVCKDYKQTGFCGFGDNCKYLHEREVFSAGWQLDREWEISTKGKKNLGGTVVASANRDGTAGGIDGISAEEEALLEKIPFVCIICKQAYKEPIVTKCGHYFCEGCALKRYRKDPTCAACGAGTNGVFNSSRRLKKLLEKKRERAAKIRQAKMEAGEAVSDEEGDD